jgi:anti-sigma B factor antagonist
MPLQARSSALRVRPRGGVTVVQFTEPQIRGEGPGEATGAHLYGLVDDGGHRHLVLNLAGVERLDSSMAARFVRLHKKVKAAGGRLALCHLSPDLLKIFQVLQLHRLLHICGDEEAAVQSVAGPVSKPFPAVAAVQQSWRTCG